MSKNTLLTLILLAIFSGGVIWLSARNRWVAISSGEVSREEASELPIESEEEITDVEAVGIPEDDPRAILLYFTNESKINFSEPEETGFEWNLNDQGIITKISVKGEKIEVKGIPNQYLDTDSFFLKNGFSVDTDNTLAGTAAGTVGYKKDQVVCLIKGASSGGEKAFLEGGNRMDVVANCGLLEEPQEETSSPEEDQKVEGASYEIDSDTPGELNVSAHGESSAKASSVVISNSQGTKRCGLVEVDGEKTLFADGENGISCEDYQSSGVGSE